MGRVGLCVRVMSDENKNKRVDGGWLIDLSGRWRCIEYCVPRTGASRGAEV
jgi:hypothetical protein